MSFKQRIIVFVLVVFMPLAGIWFYQSKYVEIQGRVFGTSYVIKAFVPKWVTKHELQTDFEREFKRLDTIFSTWNSNSELSKFNASPVTQSVRISLSL